MRDTDSSAPGSAPGAASAAGATAHEQGAGAGRAGGTSELEPLRDLLLAQERARLEALQRRVDDPEQRATDLADVLADAVWIRADDERFVESLQRPVDRCLQHSVERDPQGVADALFPVMGPAIRRAIGEALKGVVESINQAVEHSLSIKGLRWRIEAWRSGTSFAEVVLKNTLVYRVDAAYLIHNETGLLIQHALAETQTTLKDEDAMSAMLTAIQDFIQDSFTGTNEGLESVDIGGRSLWVLRGPRATLACVISGVPPRSLRERLQGTLRDLHLTFRKQLERFDGDKAPLAGVQAMLQDCLTLEYRESADNGRGGRARWLPWLVVVLLIAVAIGWLAWARLAWAQRLEAARDRLEAAPGVVVVAWEPWQDRRVRLLVDALADAPRALIADTELLGWLDLETRPYVSADAPIVVARARRQLGVPATVELELTGAVLKLAGAAPEDWVEQVERLRVLPPGVDMIDLSALRGQDRSPVAQVRAAIDPPPGVDIAVDGAKLVVSGLAPWQWIAALPDRLSTVAGVSGCDHSALRIAEMERAQAIAGELAQMRFEFGKNYRLSPRADEPLDRAAELISELLALTQVAPFGVEIDVIGYSDQSGTPRWRDWLRERRANRVIEQLTDRGVAAAVLHPVPREGFEVPAEPASLSGQARLEIDLDALTRPACRVG